MVRTARCVRPGQRVQVLLYHSSLRDPGPKSLRWFLVIPDLELILKTGPYSAPKEESLLGNGPTAQRGAAEQSARQDCRGPSCEREVGTRGPAAARVSGKLSVLMGGRGHVVTAAGGEDGSVNVCTYATRHLGAQVGGPVACLTKVAISLDIALFVFPAPSSLLFPVAFQLAVF